MLIEPASPVSRPRGPRAVVDARPVARAAPCATRARDVVERRLRVSRASSSPRAGVADDLAERAHRLGDAVERAVEQQVRDAGLLLHAVGERDVGGLDRAVVDDQVRLRGEHDLDVGGVAAPGQASERGQVRVLRRDEGPLRRAKRRRPAEQLVGRDREHEDRRRRSGRVDARDVRRDLGAAPRVVDDGPGRLAPARRAVRARPRQPPRGTRVAMARPATCRR